MRLDGRFWEIRPEREREHAYARLNYLDLIT